MRLKLNIAISITGVVNVLSGCGIVISREQNGRVCEVRWAGWGEIRCPVNMTTMMMFLHVYSK